MIILEKGKQITQLNRVFRKPDGDYLISQIEFVVINDFQSISGDGWNIEIIVNANYTYEINLSERKDIKDFILEITKAERREPINMEQIRYRINK